MAGSKINYLFLKNINESIKEFIDIINSQNFYETFPGANFKEILPELPLDKNGYPQIDYSHYTVNSGNFKIIVGDYVEMYFNIFSNNTYINMIKVFYVPSSLDVSSEINDTLKHLIHIYGKDKLQMDNDGNLSLMNGNHSNSSWNEEFNDYYESGEYSSVYIYPSDDLFPSDDTNFNSEDFKDKLENYNKIL